MRNFLKVPSLIPGTLAVSRQPKNSGAATVVTMKANNVKLKKQEYTIDKSKVYRRL